MKMGNLGFEGVGIGLEVCAVVGIGIDEEGMA